MQALEFQCILKRSYSDVKGKYKFCMIRHGESEWNQKNLFCGWYNAQLTPKGVQQAVEAGKLLKKDGMKFDVGFTSALDRARKTLEIILKTIEQTHIPVYKSWRLNERHYGALTGYKKSEMAEKYGEKQVAIWRRSYDVLPPPMEPDHPYHKTITNDPIYKDGPSPEEFPKTETLKLTIMRVLPFWEEKILPEIKAGKSVIIVSHGTSVRAILKHLNQGDESITKLFIPNCTPVICTLDENFKPLSSGSIRFLGDPKAIKEAMAKDAARGKIRKMIKKIIKRKKK